MYFWSAAFTDKKQPKRVGKMPEIRKNRNFVVATIFLKNLQKNIGITYKYSILEYQIFR